MYRNKRKVYPVVISLYIMISSMLAQAQSPRLMSYQSVIRDNANQLVSNRPIRIRMSILPDSAGSTAFYVETHQVTTTVLGLVQLQIGGGTVASGSFAAIPWARGKMFLRTETDFSGGTNFSSPYTTQLLSVPYAMYSDNVPVSKSGDTVTIGKSRLIIPGSTLVSSEPALSSLSTGLVAYYPFNGNANDESGNGNHGQVFGANLTVDRLGNPNRAYFFDGINDYIEIADTSTLDISGSISISLWFRPFSIGMYRLVDKSTVGDSDAYMLDFSDSLISVTTADRIRFIVADSYSNQPRSKRFGLMSNVLYHLTATYNLSEVKFYINGILNNTIPKTGLSRINTNPLRFGASSTLYGNWFHGVMDEIRIYNRVLSQQEITYLASN